jgi:hypothetical protein
MTFLPSKLLIEFKGHFKKPKNDSIGASPLGASQSGHRQMLAVHAQNSSFSPNPSVLTLGDPL